MKATRFVKKTIKFSKNLDIDFVKKLFVFDIIDSTNSKAKKLAHSGAEEGTVIIARMQQHGRGRFDRVWQSPEGGIYLSLILRPKISIEKISLIPFVAGLAVAKTIDSYGLQTTIKWPNDVLVNQKKIAGILIESEIEGLSICYVVVGIGMNLNIDINVLSPDIQFRSTSLFHEIHSAIDYYEFLRIFFSHFEKEYSNLINHRYEKLIDEWKMHSDTLGKTIRVQTTMETFQGVAFDIDPSGFLLLRTTKGEKKKIYSGDCLYFNELDNK